MINVLILTDSRDFDKEHTILADYVAHRCKGMDVSKYIFVVPAQSRKSCILYDTAHAIGNQAVLLRVNDTQGTACTGLWAISHINNDDELLILSDLPPNIDADLILQDFHMRDLSAGIVFSSPLSQNNASVEIFSDDNCIESEKMRDNEALAGFFWFARGRDFVNAAQSIIRKNSRIRGFLDLASIYSVLLKQKISIGNYPVDEDNGPNNFLPSAAPQRRSA